MTNDGFRELGVFDDHENRWEVARGSTAAHSWIELRHLVYDDDDDMYVQDASMVIPDSIASQIAEAMSAVVDVPLNVQVVAGDLLVETIRLLNQARQKDFLGFMATLRDVHADRETVSVVIGQLVHLTLAAMIELLDDADANDDGEDVDSVLHRWLAEAVGVDATSDGQIDDAEIAAFLDRERGRDD